MQALGLFCLVFLPGVLSQFIRHEDCERSSGIVSGWYHECSREVYQRYYNLPEGEQLTGHTYIDALEGLCEHLCDIYDCLKTRHSIESCPQSWQDTFYDGVNAAQSVCEGMRLRTSVRRMLSTLRLDRSDPRWARCSRGAFPSIPRCYEQIRTTMNSRHGVGSFFDFLSQQEFPTSAEHKGVFLESLTHCVYNSSINAGCDPRWAKLVAIYAIGRLGDATLINYGVNTSELLFKINLGQSSDATQEILQYHLH